MQAQYDKFKKEIVKSYFNGEIVETAKEVIREEYINARKHGCSCSKAMKEAADEIGCSNRTVRRIIYE